MAKRCAHFATHKSKERGRCVPGGTRPHKYVFAPCVWPDWRALVIQRGRQSCEIEHATSLSTGASAAILGTWAMANCGPAAAARLCNVPYEGPLGVFETAGMQLER
eukprot:365889-Chlamydomonas_euryale.AAC.4